MNEAKLISLLGLAQKAGKLATGELAVEKAIRSGKVKLLLVAKDATDSTKKGYRDIAAYYEVAYRETLSKDQIGNATGKSPRAAVAIIDAGFYKIILETLA